MPKTFGGKKQEWRNPKEYRKHLREMVRQGMGTTADGTWVPGSQILSQAAHKCLVYGYRLG